MEEDRIMLDRLYLIKLIDQLRNFEGSEEDEAVFLEKLVNLVTDPNISDYRSKYIRLYILDRHELRGNS